MGLFGGIKDAAKSVGHAVTHPKETVKKARKAVDKKINKVVHKAHDIKNDVKKGVQGLTQGKKGFGALKAAGSSIGGHFKAGVKSGFNDIKQGVKNKVNNVRRDISKKVDSVKKDVSKGWNDFKRGAKTVGNSIKKGVKKYGPEALKIGAVVGAGAIGFAAGGPAGAAVAGGLAAGAISAYDQKRKTGKIDPLKVGANALMGAIPGGGGTLAKVGGAVGSKVGGKLLATSGGKALQGAGTKVAGKLPSGLKGATAGKGAAIKDAGKNGFVRATDGASFGFRFGAGNTAYDTGKKGKVDWDAALRDGGRGAISGALSGAAVGGASAGVANRWAARNRNSDINAGLRPTPNAKPHVGEKVARKAEEVLPVPSGKAQKVGRKVDDVIDKKVGVNYLGGTLGDRIAHVFGRKAPVQTRQNIKGDTKASKAHAAEQLAASPTGLLLETGDQIGKRILYSNLQNTNFLP